MASKKAKPAAKPSSETAAPIAAIDLAQMARADSKLDQHITQLGGNIDSIKVFITNASPVAVIGAKQKLREAVDELNRWLKKLEA